jgi:hypothetical protein
MSEDNIQTIADILNSKKHEKKLNSFDMNYNPEERCACKDKSIISYYAKCEDNTIAEISYECKNCDNLLSVVLELFCDKIQGKQITNALKMKPKEIVDNQMFKILDTSKQKLVKNYFNLAKTEFRQMIQESKDPSKKKADSYCL